MFDNGKFVMEAAKKASDALKYLEESSLLNQPTIGGDRYNEELMESKLTKDAGFLVQLCDYLEEGEKEQFFKCLEDLMENTRLLFAEIDMKPRTCSRAIDSGELTESVQHGLYANYITENVNKKFKKPLFEGTLIQDNKREVSLLMEAALEADPNSTLDSELFLKYAIFENTIGNNIKNIMLPEILESRVNAFLNTQDEKYFEIFENSADVLLKNIEESSTMIASLISPKLFINSLEENTKITFDDVNKFKGISKILNQ